jgi:NarL family two-component system response regulator LiaR
MSSQGNADPIRVLLVDDHAILRDGMCALLATEPGIEVVGEADNGRDAVSKAQSLRPDVILMDLAMPEMDGIEAIRHIVARQPGAHILVLTSFAADDKVFPAIKAGAMGYLLKDTESGDLIRAIHQVHRGESSLHPKIAHRLLQELAHSEPPPTAAPADSNYCLGPSIADEPDWPSPRREPSAQALSRDADRELESLVDPLTEREVQVLKLVARGQSNREIADQLVVAEGTVRTHVSNILSKLHLASRTQATLYALRKGLTSL